MRHPDQILAPGLGPAGGTADLPGHPAHHRVLGVGAELGPERSADVRGDDPQARRFDREHVRQSVARALGALVRDPRRQPAVVAPHGGGRARLHRRGRDTLVDDGAGDDHVAAIEQIRVERGGVAERGGDVRAGIGEQHGRVAVGGGLVQPDHRRQRVVVDVHQLHGVLALVPVLGDHHGHRLPHEPDHIPGQERLAHLPVDHAGHRRRQHREAGQVGAGERGDHTGCLPRGADVDGADPRVRDRGPDEEHVTGPGELDVVGVDGTGRQETRVLRPPDPGTENAHARSAPSRDCHPTIVPGRASGGQTAYPGNWA